MRSHRQRTLLAALLVAACSTAGLAAVPTAASAAPVCPADGFDCDGQDPNRFASCQAGSTIDAVEVSPVYGSTLELRHGSGTCSLFVWARLTTSTEVAGWAEIRRSNGTSYRCYVGYGGTCWTTMAYDPSGYTAYAYGHVVAAGGFGYSKQTQSW
jgi:hypothetical protein